ncbi:hypothetical protein CPC735_002700 [Coccidioides posadasii C735 delta SOWgp]|uniref:Mitochondrial phosphate carrier protein n=3 Tax=Coccidioides posadasii TaxID=199306 RepID=E9D0U2_COCPS|nr:hypothetical protein CPC735_002700 [Coccidioides posadasii C735 delta SOWgp]EER26101.1 hypothetical protein CPC735_002700 [Coccidioides posadasii C735 delta SOWgp]EFW19946.1 conserved hypothetical protein [Coccidioides posadasii str. Silveira]KMM73484.1 hypothetical protein CPAG_09773 [Coccidioides posadasii RMSCC 3488]|eukprot:XP_003068246.1 hypothetical protein CPC735_002700 [Coccidioides posadasii C735 delta SOWgp]
MLFTRSVSLTNFIVASSALCFQVFVLYPWHKQLDDSFEALKKEHMQVLQREMVQIEELRSVREQLREVMARQRKWF